MQAISGTIPSLQTRLSSPLKQASGPIYPLLVTRLREAHLDESARLQYNSPFECLIAAILLTQSSTTLINSIAPELFSRYPTAEAMAVANRRELELLIRDVGFYRRKAKQLMMTSRMIVLNYDSRVPNDLMSLTRLPGVARRTANLIMGELYNQTEGIIVDMRVRRVLHRLGIASGKSAETVEKQLMEITPKEDWIEFPRLIMQLGETNCVVQNPRCLSCPLKSLCPQASASGRTNYH